MAEAGKGSGARPLSISKDQFANNWDTIFGKKEKPVEKFNECPVPCHDCSKNNVDCFQVTFDSNFALVDA
jgi:hypothetical protein